MRLESGDLIEFTELDGGYSIKPAIDELNSLKAARGMNCDPDPLYSTKENNRGLPPIASSTLILILLGF